MDRIVGILTLNLNKIRIRRLRWRWSSLAIVLLVLLFPNPGSPHLNLVKECGEIICQELEYCNKFDHTCKPCSVICSKGGNFQKETCESECQDYLHDERYIRTGNGSGANSLSQLYKNLQKDVLILKILVGVSIFVILVTIASFISFVIYFWRFIHPSASSSSKRGRSTKESDKEKKEMPTIYNNKYAPDLSSGHNNLNSAGGGVVNHNSATDNHNLNQSPRSGSDSSNTNNRDSDESFSTRPSPSKSETSSTRTNPGTMSTLVNNSLNSTNTNSRFRREPSESTIPEYLACDNTSMGPGIIPYTSHV